MSELNAKQDVIRHKGRDFRCVSSELAFRDILGTWKVRFGIGRMTYSIDPGLYALGNPTEFSPVFVTANYKLTFDHLRSHLAEINAWILVLDTKGINVWCAAGKGTFGTSELVNRIIITGLSEIVDHRLLILPQLGASGVSAHLVKKQSGFNVKYGPVRAEDIRTYLNAGMKATPEMRTVRFNLKDRAVLIPVELMSGLKYTFIAAFLMLVIYWLLHLTGGSDVGERFLANPGFVLAACTYLASIIFGMLLLPYLAGRAFSVKGIWIGLAAALVAGLIEWKYYSDFHHWINILGALLILPAISSFVVMNYTGSSTFTSLSGVRKEMKVAVPLQIAGFITGFVIWAIFSYI